MNAGQYDKILNLVREGLPATYVFPRNQNLFHIAADSNNPELVEYPLAHTHTTPHAHAHAHMRTLARTNEHTFARTNTHSHAHTHARTHTRAHACTALPSLRAVLCVGCPSLPHTQTLTNAPTPYTHAHTPCFSLTRLHLSCDECQHSPRHQRHG